MPGFDRGRKAGLSPFLIANEAGSSIVGIDGFLSELGQHRDRVTPFPIAVLGSLSLAASALTGEDAAAGSGLKGIHTARNIAASPVSWLLAFIRQGQTKVVASLPTNHDLITDCTALALRHDDRQLRFCPPLYVAKVEDGHWRPLQSQGDPDQHRL